MPLLLLFLAMLVIVGLVFWRVSTQTSYRVKNRDELRERRTGRSADRQGPDLRDMLD